MDRSGKNFEAAGSDLAALFLPAGASVAGSWLAGRLREEWQRCASVALRVAEARTGMKREDLEEIVSENPVLLPLYVRILWAAGMNGHDETLRAMGAVFAEAVKARVQSDEDRLEEADLALGALASLGPRHFRVLRALAEEPEDPQADPAFTRPVAPPRKVAERAGLAEESASQCLLNLAGTGLITEWPGLVLGGTVYQMSDLGWAVLEAAAAVRGGSD